MSTETFSYESRFSTSSDGLRLHTREYCTRDAQGLPVVCLAGLTRNSADFDPLATALATGHAGTPRRVLALDYRGRGRSDYDPNWRNYSLEVENADILSVLRAETIDRAVFIGTSRGGLHAMNLSATCPGVIAGTVLNDIGPVLEPKGVARILSYIGKIPVPRTLDEAVATVRSLMADRFTALGDAEWLAFAKATFVDSDGGLRLLYDRNLMMAFAESVAASPLPTCWPLFEGLRGRPVLVIRGANSDLLSPETVAEMVDRHDDCAVHVVEGQGHAPLLADAATIGRIGRFIAEAEAAASGGA